MNRNSYVAIMAGGIGSRFWPVSRLDFPKQFLDILNTGRTLIQSTYDRFSQFIPVENIYVVTANIYKDLVKSQLPDLPDENIVCEPSRKNTAPCIAYISYKLQQLNPESNLICAPADHLILDNTLFKKVCYEALGFTERNQALLTLGIKPFQPNTGYGYIQHEEVSIQDNIFKVKTFTEKPDLELAKTFLASGDFLWNAGIFVWKTKEIISAFEKYLPEIHELFFGARVAMNTDKEEAAIELIYPICENISIDYGILEKANNVYVIPSTFGWSDLGTWGSAFENLEKDYMDNATAGKNIILFDSNQNIIHSSNKAEKLILIQGLNDFIVVDTPDALLICKKANEQNLKEYLAEVKRNIGEQFL
ncbi:MAG: mannose-1-phosphate guanylyltransferase [Bacteroidetes bacterium]|nr:mannose-1-phosphate guanylyltransferase [Bacteroidota bacterium]